MQRIDALPKPQWCLMRTTNGVERIRLVCTLLMEISDDWQVAQPT